MSAPFKKHNKLYPLTTFAKFLADQGRTPSVIHNYVTALRGALAAVDGDWKNFDGILAHYQFLPRLRQDNLSAAWNYFRAFTQADLPRISCGRDAATGPIAEALVVLVSEYRRRHPGKHTNTILKLRWFRVEDRWIVAESRGGPQVFGSPLLAPALKRAQTWGYLGLTANTLDCKDGAWFLPDRPHGLAIMSETRFYTLIRDRRDAVACAALAKEMVEAKRALTQVR